MDSIYDRDFYRLTEAQAKSSSNVIVPLLNDLVQPVSVIDIGCGTGAWAATFQEFGCRVLGVDGPYVDRSKLVIHTDDYILCDLSNDSEISGLVAQVGSFDLAICLEVAEHLQEGRAGPLVAVLTELADAVLFSAAVPEQGGTGHVNEQWPSYWAEHFAVHGYSACDVVRERVWNDERVSFWYAQNTVLYLRAGHDALDRVPQHLRRAPSEVLSLVHPRLLGRALHRGQMASGLSNVVKRLPGAAVDAVRHRLRR